MDNRPVLKTTRWSKTTARSFKWGAGRDLDRMNSRSEDFCLVTVPVTTAIRP